MRVKDMCLKNENFFYILFGLIFFFCANKVYSNVDDKSKILEYLSSLKHFSASFMQNDGESLSEGKFYIGEKRVRAEYFNPEKILIILDEDKAMYYNYELDEDEFFDPKDTYAWVFYEIFRNPFFFEDSKFQQKNSELVLEKKGLDKEKRDFKITIYLENNPLILRKVEVLINEDLLQLSIYNHIYNEVFDSSYFKLINPKFFD